MNQPGLFPTPEPDEVWRSSTLERETCTALRDDRPRWTRYRPRNRIQCSECVLVLHEHRGQGPAIRGARWRLTIGKNAWYLCDSHANLRKQGQ